MATNARTRGSRSVPLRTPPQRRPSSTHPLPSDRDALILRHDGLARHVAGWYEKTGHDPEDLLAAARYGLIRAVDGYDPSRGTVFSTYATWKIRNAVEAELRSSGVYHSGMRGKPRLLQAAADGLRALRHGATGKVREAAIESLDAWREWQADPSGRPRLVSLETPTESDGGTLWDIVSDGVPGTEAVVVDRISREERSRQLRNALRHLSRRQRHVVVRCYLCGWPVDQVRRELGVRAVTVQGYRDDGLERLYHALEGVVG